MDVDWAPPLMPSAMSWVISLPRPCARCSAGARARANSNVNFPSIYLGRKAHTTQAELEHFYDSVHRSPYEWNGQKQVAKPLPAPLKQVAAVSDCNAVSHGRAPPTGSVYLRQPWTAAAPEGFPVLPVPATTPRGEGSPALEDLGPVPVKFGQFPHAGFCLRHRR